MSTKNCPCGRNKTYSDCCNKAHKDISTVKTAEDLMRSRYSAFVLANVDYLILSWSSKTRDNSTKAKKELKNWAKSVTWVKLEVINSNKGLENDTTGTVEFKAFFYENGKLDCIQENSFFEKEHNHWVYVDRI